MELYLHAGMGFKSYREGLRLHLGDYLMEFFLQFGYGMMDHSRSLIREWGKGTVILSPRDLSDQQLRKLANEINELGGNVLLDPQFYLPHADHARLCSHDYWPNEYESLGFWSGPDLKKLLTQLASLNSALGSKQFILPGLFAPIIDDLWLSQQKTILEEAERLNLDNTKLMATIALGSDAIRNVAQVHALLEESSSWLVGGIYLICEHPQGSYLVNDPSWLANVLDLIAGFRLRNRQVVVGYCNHQMLVAASASASAIASGTWMNVRSFPPEKFKAQYDEEMKQRTTWYYCPQALSEYKITFLDIAYRQGILNEMTTPSEFGSIHSHGLFKGVQPTTVGFSEQSAFRHYLQCLKSQAESCRKDSYHETIAAHQLILDEAEQLLLRLHSFGVKGQGRDFKDMLDASRAALSVLDNTRGPMLRRNWAKL